MDDNTMILWQQDKDTMDKVFSLGSKLRALRRERDLTQRELARRAGISANAVSLIERDAISPSIATLQSLAAAFGVKMSYFFDEDVQTSVMHVKAGERPSLESAGVRIESLGKRLRGQELEPFFICLAPNSESGRRQVIHPGHEFVYCLRGRIEYEIDGEVYALNAGDFLLFEAQLAHHWRNPTQDQAELLLVLQTPAGSHEPVRRHFSDYPSLTHIG
jgi:transcriptional regulator with XRE-family HTH domain